MATENDDDDDRFETITDFKVLKGSTEEELEEKINDHAKQGYGPVQFTAAQQSLWVIMKCSRRVERPRRAKVVGGGDGPGLVG